MTEFSEIDLLELSEFMITSEKEKQKCFINVNKERIFVSVTIYDSNKTINHIKFASYIFLDEENNFKLEFLADNFNEKKFEDSVVVGVFNLGGVKFVFESDIESWDKNGNNIELNIFTPKTLIKYQRRDAFRINVPAKYDIKIDLCDGKVNLPNLRVTNISLLGAAILMNTEESFLEQNTEFKNSKIHLNFNNRKQQFNVGIKVSRKKEVQEPSAGKVEGKWFEVGVKFENILPRMEQEISLLINELSRKL